MTHRLLHLQIHQKLLVVIVRTFSETVVAAQAMDVAGESGEVSACEEGRAGAHDALDHADRVGIHIAQHTLALKVTQKANLPAGLDKRLPTRLEQRQKTSLNEHTQSENEMLRKRKSRIAVV